MWAGLGFGAVAGRARIGGGCSRGQACGGGGWDWARRQWWPGPVEGSAIGAGQESGGGNGLEEEEEEEKGEEEDIRVPPMDIQWISSSHKPSPFWLLESKTEQGDLHPYNNN